METSSRVAAQPGLPGLRNVARRLRSTGRFLRTKPLGGMGLVILVLFVLIAALGPTLAAYDPAAVNARERLLAPGAAHWFGTDQLGRDILARTMYGARISMFVGIVVVLCSTSIAAMIGVSSAYFGGKYDLIVQRFVDAKSAFPALLLALTLVAAFGTSFGSILTALIIIYSSRGVRAIRSLCLSLKEYPYVDAARTIGASERRILFRHILPNTFGVTMVVATATMGAAILTEASLSFLGVGMPESVISWGGMLSNRMIRHLTVAPWIGLFPGAALTLVVFSTNVLGDALRDVLDPKLRGK